MLGRAMCVRGALAAAILWSAMAGAAAGQSVFSSAGPIAGQLSGPASPYPSEIVVSGLTEPVALVRVRLNGLSHELSTQEFDILLVAPTGETVLLMSDVGALAPVSGLNLVFDDDAPAMTFAALSSGTYAPTNLNDGIGTDGFDPPAPAGPYGGTLAAFRGKDANGTWKLFVMDDTGGDAGAIASWALEIFVGTCVTSTADSGAGSLRLAITTANSNPDVSTICFLIPDGDPGHDAMAGTWTIAPTSPLPAITTPVIIDGLLQSGAGCAGAWPPALSVVLSGAAAGPGSAGLLLGAGASGSTIRGLVINGWSGPGIDLNGPSVCRVQGCFIGTDHTGLAQVANGGDGVRIRSGGSANIIGSDDDAVNEACERNVISGNGGAGVRASDIPGAMLYGNLIGVGVDGASPLGNLGGGVVIESSGGVHLFGNVISANRGAGVRIEGAAPVRLANALLGNLIGTDESGENARGNDGDGVTIADGAEFTFITGGSPVTPIPNVIAFNAGNGVRIVGPSRQNFITWNSIHSNGLLGIDLGGDGVTPNDPPPDADSGPNDLLNFPVVTSIVGTTISGVYAGPPSGQFEIDVYQNESPDPSGHGEGKTFLGRTSCVTDGAGLGVWSLANVVYRTTPRFISATATDAGLQIGTSEFGPVALTNLCKIACPSGPVEIAAGPACTAVAMYGVGLAGNCDPNVQLVFNPPEGTVLPLGGTSVTAMLTDAAGMLLDECTFEALVVDTTPPVLVCPGTITQPSQLNECGASVGFIVGVSDACDPAPTVTYSIPDGMGGQTLISPPHFFPVGTTTVTVNATDSSGNAATPCTFDVVVNDVQGPILNCQPVFAEADAFGNVILTQSLVFPGGVLDNCPDCAVESLLFSPPFIECAALQPYVISVTAMDCRGNTSTCTVTVTVTGPDCNENGISDGCDIRNGTSADCNRNLIPDECECLWCNGAEPEDPAAATGQASHLGGGAPMGTKVVDDIYFAPGTMQRLTAFEGVMLTDSFPLLRRAMLEFYDDCDGRPAGAPFLTVGYQHASVVSVTPASDGLYLVKYRFDLCDLCLWLEGGKTYWVGLTGLSDNVDGSDLSFWVVDEREEARIIGRPPFKAEGTTTPGWAGPYVMGPWMPIEECCIGCSNMVFCIFGDSCKVIWDNGAAGTAQADAAASPPSGAHRAFEARAADDFVMPTCEPQDVCLIDAWVWTDCEPPHGFIEIYANQPCHSPSPELEPIIRLPADKMIDTGRQATLSGRTYRLYIVRVMDPGLVLPPGRTLWLGAGVESTGSFVVGSRFALAHDVCRACPSTIGPAHGRSIRPAVTPWLALQPVSALAFRIATRAADDLIPAATPPPSPACLADANYDGQVAVDDIFTFLSAWFAGCP